MKATLSCICLFLGVGFACDVEAQIANADVAVSKIGQPTYQLGGDLVFSIVVINNGPSDATNVVVDDVTPPGIFFDSNAGYCFAGFPCDLGTVPAGQSRTITTTFGVPAGYSGPSQIVNTATVSSPDDSTPGNNSSSATADQGPAFPDADVAILKTRQTDFEPGSDFVFSIVVTNNGPSDATNVVVDDATPLGLVFVGNAGNCFGGFPCDLGTVPAGQSRTITATFAVPPDYAGPSLVINTATVSSPDDSTPNNNSSSAAAGQGPAIPGLGGPGRVALAMLLAVVGVLALAWRRISPSF